MESLERLASSIAQTELLVASLKRENRELAARLAVSAEERREETAQLRAGLADLEERLALSEAAPRRDPGLEARAFDAEHRAVGAERSLREAQEAHQLERSRLEALIRQLEAQVMASHGSELLPTASVEALDEAHTRERAAKSALAEAENRSFILATQVKSLQTRLDGLLDAEQRGAEGAQALRAALEALRLREAGLEQGLAARDHEAQTLRAELDAALKARDEGEHELKSLRAESADLGKIQAERAELRRQRREAQAVARERQALRRRLEELLSTLESVRL